MTSPRRERPPAGEPAPVAKAGQRGSRLPGPGVSEVVEAYLSHLAQRGLAANSLAAYRRDLQRYRAHCLACGRSRLDEVQEPDVAAYLALLRAGDATHKGLSEASAARAMVSVRGLHRFAADTGYTSADPGRAVHQVVAERPAPNSLSVAQVEAILAGTGGTGGSLGLRDRALLEFLYGTGARISEAVGLDLADIDREGGSALLVGPGGRMRRVPLIGQAGLALAGYLDRGRPDLLAGVNPAVFLNARGGRLSRQSAWTVIQSATDRARIPGPVSPNTLRHSCADHLEAAGVAAADIAELLGTGAQHLPDMPAIARLDRLSGLLAGSHPRART